MGRRGLGNLLVSLGWEVSSSWSQYAWCIIVPVAKADKFFSFSSKFYWKTVNPQYQFADSRASLILGTRYWYDRQKSDREFYCLNLRN